MPSSGVIINPRAGAVDDLVQPRRAMFMCYGCSEHRMPTDWRTRHGYTSVMGGLQTEATCDYCQTVGRVRIYVREEGALAQQSRYFEDVARHQEQGHPDIVSFS